MSNQMITGYHDLYWALPGANGSTSVTLGSTGPDGVIMESTPHINFITGDVLGPETEVDGVFQGWSTILQFMLQEVKTDIAKQFLQPFPNFIPGGSITTEQAGYFGIPGTLLSSYMGYLTAVPRTGTPAASYKTGGAARRFVGLSVGSVRESLDTGPRFVPVTFRAFPFADSADSSALKMWKWVAAGNTTGTP